MSDGQNKQHTKQESGSKTQPSNQVGNWRRIVDGVFHDLFFGSYAANVITSIAFLLVGPAIGLIINSKRGVVIGAGIGFTLLIWIVVIAVIRRIGEPVAPPPALVDFSPVNTRLDEMGEELKVVIAQSIASINSLHKKENIPEPQLPGMAVHFFLKLGKPIEGRVNYILDAGEGENRNRLSVYIDTKSRLCVRVIDENGSPVVLSVPSKLETFDFDKLTYIGCEFGTSDSLSVVRLLINGREVEAHRQASLISVSKPLNEYRWMLGADLNGENGGVFAVTSVAFGGGLSPKKKCSVFWSTRIKNGATLTNSSFSLVSRGWKKGPRNRPKTSKLNCVKCISPD